MVVRKGSKWTSIDYNKEQNNGKKSGEHWNKLAAYLKITQYQSITPVWIPIAPINLQFSIKMEILKKFHFLWI